MFQGDRQMLGVSISLRLHYSDLTPDKTSILGGGMVFNVLYTAWPTKFLQILPIRHVQVQKVNVFRLDTFWVGHLCFLCLDTPGHQCFGPLPYEGKSENEYRMSPFYASN